MFSQDKKQGSYLVNFNNLADLCLLSNYLSTTYGYLLMSITMLIYLPNPHFLCILFGYFYLYLVFFIKDKLARFSHRKVSGRHQRT